MKDQMSTSSVQALAERKNRQVRKQQNISISQTFFFVCVEIGSCYVAHAGFELGDPPASAWCTGITGMRCHFRHRNIRTKENTWLNIWNFKMLTIHVSHDQE
jgi:hypothetical protein